MDKQKTSEGLRVCKKCGHKKAIESFNWIRKPYREHTCKVCRYGEAKDRYKENREEYNKYRREWNKKNPEKTKAYFQKYYKTHGDLIKERSKRYRRGNPEKILENYLRCTFGIGIKEYEELNKLQNGLCAICTAPETHRHQNGKIKRLSVDHDHITGLVRGLLCDSCNSMLGRAKDSTLILLRAVDYLHKHTGE